MEKMNNLIDKHYNGDNKYTNSTTFFKEKKLNNKPLKKILAISKHINIGTKKSP